VVLSLVSSWQTGRIPIEGMVMYYRRVLVAACIIFTMLIATMSARADKPTALDLAVTQVQDQTGGRILRARAVRDADGRLLFRIKVLLPDGRIKVFLISPDNG